MQICTLSGNGKDTLRLLSAVRGLDGWRLHELRHTYLTPLAIQGMHPKVM